MTSGGPDDPAPPATSSRDETRVLRVVVPADEPTRIVPGAPVAAPTRVVQAVPAVAAASPDPAAATLPPKPPAGVRRPAAQLAPGETFGDFEIEAELGRGEMGIVYRVRRRRLDRVEALKIIAPKYAEDPEFAERFLREAALAASAHHPNIVTVYDDGEQGGRLFLAMEYVDGEDLRKRIASGGPLAPSNAASITRQVADALDAAHDAGLVHRDVKPANILLTNRRGTDHACLTDFGVSRRIVAANDLTLPGSFVGAPGYAAPEQHEGRPVDARTDVYSLGCVLFEMLTGEVPFHGTTATAVAIAHITQLPPAPSAVNRTVPAAFDAIIATALAKNPDDRYPTARQLGEAAVAAAETAVHARTQSLPRVTPDVDPDAATIIRRTVSDVSPTAPGPARRGRSRAVLAVAAVIAVAAAVGIAIAAGGAAGEAATVISQVAHVRTAPNPDASLISTLTASQSVTVTCWTKGAGGARGWVRLASPNGYVAADLLSPVVTTPHC